MLMIMNKQCAHNHEYHKYKMKNTKKTEVKKIFKNITNI